MKSKIQNALLAIAVTAGVSFAVSSCSKKSENASPVITLVEPADGESIAVTDSLHIEGNFSDDEGLHEASILVVKSTGDTAFQQYPYVHDLKTYSFHYHFKPSSAGSYTLKVVAEDHDEMRSEKNVSFTVN